METDLASASRNDSSVNGFESQASGRFDATAREHVLLRVTAHEDDRGLPRASHGARR